MKETLKTDNKEERLSLMDDILDGLDKKREESFTYDDYKDLETKYSKLQEMYNKKSDDYDSLYNKYEERFINAVSTYNSSKEDKNSSIEDKEELKEVNYIDIQSIF